jgi:hypothetical protein
MPAPFPVAPADGKVTGKTLAAGFHFLKPPSDRQRKANKKRGYSMPSNSTSKMSVLFGGIAGLGLFAP